MSGSLNIKVVDMRPMRVLSAYIKGTNRTEVCSEDAFDAEYTRLTGGYKCYHGEHFEGHSNHSKGYMLTRRIPDDCVNDSQCEDYILEGLFITEATRPDVDPAELWKSMTKILKESDLYEIDDIANGGQRDSIYGCNGDLICGDFAYWECFIPVRIKKREI